MPEKGQRLLYLLSVTSGPSSVPLCSVPFPVPTTHSILFLRKNSPAKALDNRDSMTTK